MRQIDRIRIGILGSALLFGFVYPVASIWAQSQDAINATFAERVINLSTRLDKLENMVYGVLVLLAGQIASQVVNIKRAPEGRR